jgi:hypothetical protein
MEGGITMENPSMPKTSVKMRDLVIAVGGPLEAAENRKGWLVRVSERAGISYRVVAAAFYGEQMGQETETKLKLAAGKYEAEILADRFEHLARSLRHRDADFHLADIAALVDAARALRGLGSSKTDE